MRTYACTHKHTHTTTHVYIMTWTSKSCVSTFLQCDSSCFPYLCDQRDISLAFLHDSDLKLSHLSFMSFSSLYLPLFFSSSYFWTSFFCCLIFQPHLLATAGFWVCNIWNQCRCWPCTGETKWYNRRGTKNRGASCLPLLLSPSSAVPLLLPLNLFPFFACLIFPDILPTFLTYSTPFFFSFIISSTSLPACCTLNAACWTWSVSVRVWERHRFSTVVVFLIHFASSHVYLCLCHVHEICFLFFFVLCVCVLFKLEICILQYFPTASPLLLVKTILR